MVRAWDRFRVEVMARIEISLFLHNIKAASAKQKKVIAQESQNQKTPKLEIKSPESKCQKLLNQKCCFALVKNARRYFSFFCA